MSQVSYGTITITDTTDIERIYVEYCRSTSNQLNTSVNPPVVPNITVAWSENTPPWVNGQYIWQRSVVKKSGSTNLTYGTPVCLTGAAGATGAAGQSLTATKTEYTIAASNVTINLSNHTSYTWTTNTPDYDSSKPAYWGRITNTYTNPAKTEYLFYKDEALTKAVADAAIANSVAQHANEDAQGAMSQAAAAQQLATQVDTLLGGHFLWHGTALSSLTKAGARVVEQVKNGTTDVSSTPSQWHHNVNIGADGIQLRYNEAVMAQLAANQTSGNTALKFYKPPTVSGSTTTQGALAMELSSNALKFYGSSTSIADATLNSTGLKLAKGGIIVNTPGANNGVYISSDNLGSTITSLDADKTNWRAVIGSKFGVDSEGNLYANNATISGAITVQAGSNVYTKTEADGAFDAYGAATDASYSVEIKVSAVDYIANTATLVAIPYFQGSTTIPTDVSLIYTWYKDDIENSNIVGSNSNILNITNTTAMGLNHNYICVISK